LLAALTCRGTQDERAHLQKNGAAFLVCFIIFEFKTFDVEFSNDVILNVFKCIFLNYKKNKNF